jgi:hypothetical protein
MYVAFAPSRLDGLASAAILMRHARLRQKDIRLHILQNGLEPVRQSVLFLLDIVPESEESVRELAKNNKIAYWCYHQKTKFDDVVKEVSAMSDVLDRPSQCSAELVQERFMPQDSVSVSLSKIARDAELFKNVDDRSQLLSDVIASGMDPKQLVSLFSQGVFWTKELERTRQDYIRKREEALQEMEKHKLDKNYVDQNVAFYVCRNLLQSADAGEHALEHSGAEFVVRLYRNGSVIFRRSKHNRTSMAKLAEVLSGGGNAFAAGAQLNKPVTNENKHELISFVDNSVKNFFLS